MIDAIVVGVLLVFFLLIVVEQSRIRSVYKSSTPIYSRGTGINLSLDPIEASILLRLDPERTLSLLVLHMVRKNIVRITRQGPRRFVIEHEPELPEGQRLFVDAIDQVTGEFVSANLVTCYKYYVTAVSKAMECYSMQETVRHYQGIVGRAGDTVRAARSSGHAQPGADENLPWALLDEARTMTQEFPDIALPGLQSRLLDDHGDEDCRAFLEETLGPTWDVSVEELMHGIGQAPGGPARRRFH